MCLISSIALSQPPVGTSLTQFVFPVKGSVVTLLSGISGSVDSACVYRTQTPGGWGAPARGKNPGKYMSLRFPAAFPNGVIAGCAAGYSLTLTSAQAVTAFLPSGGQPNKLSQSLIDPVGYKNSLAGHLVALMLSAGFDRNDASFGLSSNLLADAVIAGGTFSGWTVQQVLDEANAVLGGCSTSHTPGEMTDILSQINESFVDGVVHNDSLFACGDIDACPHLSFLIEDVCLGEATVIINQSTNVDAGATYYLDLFNDGTVDLTSPAADLPDDTAIIIPAAGIYDFSVVVVNSNGCSDTLVDQTEVDSCNAEKTESYLSDDNAEKSLHVQSYPNPFSEISTVEFKVDKEETVLAELMNAEGKRLITIFKGTVETGKVYSYTVNGSDLSNGLFLLKITTGSGKSYRLKLVLLK
ncbi:MAG TPA: T9SS type A sorting domain-containing protein [Chitinophagales bacterium]|nr:T9SS type A sorting domain-containing protein [Chitinophagales bacterium]